MEVDKHYFDVDDIICSERKVKCKLEPGFSLDLLKGQEETSDSDGAAARRVELPYWLAVKLATLARPMLTVEMPVGYNAARRQVLEADASVCDLRRLGPYYYDFGQKLMRVCTTSDVQQMERSLIQTFTGRTTWLMRRSHYGKTDHKPPQLDKVEEQLYGIGRLSERDFSEWEQRLVSNSLQRNAKRKWNK